MLRFSFDLNDDTGHPDHIVNIFKNKNSRRVKVTTEYLQTLSQKTRAFIEGAKISEFFALTVATSEKSLGVLFVTSSKQSQVYTEGDFDTLKTVASHLAMSIEKSNQLEEETRLRKLFESYVSSEVISKSGMGKGKNFFRTGNALIVFCDLRGFTKMMNESTRPDETFQVVQKFYELVTDEVYGAGGFVNKFLGDGALAVFECSKGQENEVTQRAIAAARGIQQRSESILGKSIKISAGIHYGEVIFATVGKDPKLEYTVLGNAVNVASRLCTISKDHNNLLIISSPAVAQLNKDHGLAPMGQFSIKGIREDMELFGQEVYLEEDFT
jgi:adenylate cyclase